MQTLSLVPSEYQQKAIDWVSQGSGHAVIIARAGSGKTKTIEMIFEEIMQQGFGRVTCLAFNKVIATELGNRLGPDANATTLNSAGLRIVARYLKTLRVNARTDKWKYPNFIREYVAPFDFDNERDVTHCIGDVLSKAMAELSDGSDASLEAVISHYGIDLPRALDVQQIYHAVRAAMQYGESSARSQGILAFDDQIWLPAKWNLSQYAYKTDWVLVDEAQDLSKAKLALAMMCCDLDGGGRMLFVGDDKQAIYGFAGASADSISNIIVATKANVFTLPISYRCPVAVIEAARRIVPDIEAREDAPEGEVRWIAEANLSADLTPGSLVLCRLTAPLVTLCIQLLRARVPAQVRGRDIGRQLVKMASDALQSAPFDRFGAMLDQYVNEKAQALASLRNSEAKMADLRDRRDAIEAIVEGYSCKSILDFSTAIENLFSDVKATITLSTIHRAKGEEAMEVYIVAPSKLPLLWPNQQDWEAVQEQNLRYVAITRAMARLTFVREKSKAPHLEGGF